MSLTTLHYSIYLNVIFCCFLSNFHVQPQRYAVEHPQIRRWQAQYTEGPGNWPSTSRPVVQECLVTYRSSPTARRTSRSPGIHTQYNLVVIQFDSTQLCVSGFVLSVHEKKRTLYLLCHSNRTRIYKPPKKREPLTGLCYTSSSGLHPRCSIRDCPYSIYPAVSLSFLYEYFNTFGCFAQMRHSAARCLRSKIPPALSSSLLCVYYNR